MPDVAEIVAERVAGVGGAAEIPKQEGVAVQLDAVGFDGGPARGRFSAPPTAKGAPAAKTAGASLLWAAMRRNLSQRATLPPDKR